MKRFEEFVQGVPIPAAGVALGLAALGNLLSPFSGVARGALGACSAALVLLVVLKAAMHPAVFKDDLRNPVVATTAATLFMSLMQLATYAEPFARDVALVVWCLAIAGHLGLMAWFTKSFMARFRLTDVHATYFICYVGIVVASLTSPTFGMEALGKVLFWFGFACYIALLALVTVRYARHEVAEPAKPTFCVYAAPMSLSLAGYLAVFDEPNLAFVGALAFAAQALFLMVLTQVPKFLRLRFYPSYAAMTFPFVITATAFGSAVSAMRTAGVALGPWCDALVLAETAFAAAMVLYVFARYLGHLAGKLLEGGSGQGVSVMADVRQAEAR